MLKIKLQDNMNCNICKNWNNTLEGLSLKSIFNNVIVNMKYKQKRKRMKKHQSAKDLIYLSTINYKFKSNYKIRLWAEFGYKGNEPNLTENIIVYCEDCSSYKCKHTKYSIDEDAFNNRDYQIIMYEYRKLSCYDLIFYFLKHKIFNIEFDEVWPIHTDRIDLSKFSLSKEDIDLFYEKVKQINLNKCSLHKNIINMKPHKFQYLKPIK